MKNKPEVWQPLSINKIGTIFAPIPLKWWIAGGWALDLYLRNQTRQHDDIDIVILQRDNKILQQFLHPEWELFKAHKGELIRWRSDEFLHSKYDNLWVRKKGEKVWSYQVMLLETDGDYWVYKREKTVRKFVNEIGMLSPEGIPYLRPEIQLLYKGGSSVLREKDETDLKNVIWKLAISERLWLKKALAKQFPAGHRWCDRIEMKRYE
ncbi:nucleotidyltransferase domain-containing protein [Cytobacillus horneckiae]|uniref:nucleotidyltransferase domain-containing protein n=1 Tax=Cytobacillus horneckiae TaxID=549687 RepID=UPI00203A396C|nr:hypothetical protein [Cytobacillus horneckiae]MCM3176438.1 hypothetical protein [Cytobacillus horneckiae]